MLVPSPCSRVELRHSLQRGHSSCYELCSVQIPLLNLLVKSPLPEVVNLMDRVQVCADNVPELVDRAIQNDYEAVGKIAKRISRLETEVDDVKDAVRSKVPVRLFLPVDRRDLLRLIGQIDAIADCAEDVAVLLTLRHLEAPDQLKHVLPSFVNQVLDVVHAAGGVVGELEDLMAASFGGKTAERVIAEVRNISRLEHEADKLQDQCAKVVFDVENELSPVSVFMWSKVVKKIGAMANHAENVGDQFRLFVAA